LGGDRPRALKDYDTALSINPKMPEAYTEKSSSLLLMGDSMNALKVLDAYSTFNDTPHATIFLRRGVLKVAYRRYAEAKKDLEQVIALLPDDVSGYYWSAVANDSLHNRAGACAMMIKAWRLGGTDTPFVYVQTYCRKYASAKEVEAQEQMLQMRDNEQEEIFRQRWPTATGCSPDARFGGGLLQPRQAEAHDGKPYGSDQRYSRPLSSMLHDPGLCGRGVSIITSMTENRRAIIMPLAIKSDPAML